MYGQICMVTTDTTRTFLLLLFTAPIENWYYFVNVRNCIYDRLQF